MDTAIYAHPSYDPANPKLPDAEARQGIRRLQKFLNGKLKQFSKMNCSSKSRLIIVGHTWQLRRNFDRVKDLCRNSPNLHSVILMSCFSASDIDNDEDFAKELSLYLKETHRNKVEVIGFADKTTAGDIVRERVCSVKVSGPLSVISFKKDPRVCIY